MTDNARGEFLLMGNNSFNFVLVTKLKECSAQKEKSNQPNTVILSNNLADLKAEKFRQKNEKRSKKMLLNFSNVKTERLSTELKILKILLTLREQENVLELPLAFIEDELKISHNTLKKFLRVLRDANILKFSLKGLFTLNPDVIDFTDVCVPSALNVLRYNYKVFQSD